MSDHSMATVRRVSPSRDADTLSALVAAIYDAAIDPSIWSGVLRATSAYVGGHASAIYAKSISGMAFGGFHDDGVMSEEF